MDNNKNHKQVDKMISQNDENVVKRIESDGNEYETTTHNIELDINTLLPGTSLTVPAYDKNGNLIKEANKEFTQTDINELKRKKIKTIYYSLRSKKKLKSVPKKKFTSDENVDEDVDYIIGKESLEKYAEDIKGIFIKAKEEDKVEMSPVYNIIDSFYASVKEKDNYKLLLLDTKNIDEYITTSAVNCSLISMIVANEYQPDVKSIKNIGIAALLRDVGFVKLPDSIIKKSMKEFTKEEIIQYTKHPEITCELITKRNKYIGIDKAITKAIMEHHEYYNGTGFPKKLSEDNLDPFVSIITLADMFDYLTRNPNYSKNNLSYREALLSIFNSVKKLFEQRISSIFIKTLIHKLGLGKLFGNDHLLILNTGEIALVEEENLHNIMKPKLRIIADKSGRKYKKMFRADLKADIDREIIKAQKIKK